MFPVIVFKQNVLCKAKETTGFAFSFQITLFDKEYKPCK
jgi:hypothetical protein